MTMKTTNSNPPAPNPNLDRRQFLATTGAAVGLSLVTPQVAFGDVAKTVLNIGLIGGGGRGKWIADLFRKHGGYRVAAVADYFQDRVDQVGQEFGIPREQRFTGLSGYKRLLERPLDAVVIESPPYFHPEQAAAAVNAGKHVYLAKPVAVDVPGCQLVSTSAELATSRKLCFLVDFQAPTLDLFKDAAAQIKKGELGQVVCAEAAYQTGPVQEARDHERATNPTDPELRLRAWVGDRLLSGDVITEQNIHALDMACRLLDAAPVRAYGRGGKTRDYVGDCWDHFSVIYEFPNQVNLTFNSKQVGFGFEDIMCRVYGDKGTVDFHYDGKCLIKSKEYGNSANVTNLYTTGAESNIAAFYDCVTRGDFSNRTVAPGVRSNLATILGRTAAYRNATVTWEELIRHAERFQPDLKGLKA